MKIKTVKETNWRNYLVKAKQFQETAREAFQKGNWNAVGLNAIYAAISANDAVTVHHKQIRSASANHSDCVKLLMAVLPDDLSVQTFSRHLLGLINKKNLIEYEARLFQEKEAEEAIKHADRFLDWAKGKLKA